MMIAIAGETNTETVGTAIATARILRAFARVTVTPPGDSSMTGNKVHIDMDQRPTTLNPAMNAAPAGLSSVVQKDNVTSRRPESRGHSIFDSRGSGHAKRIAKVTGNAT